MSLKHRVKKIEKELVPQAKIKEDYPEIKSSYSLALEAKALWGKIKRKMTLEEKSELFDINFNKGTEAYIAKLKELVEKYKK